MTSRALKSSQNAAQLEREPRASFVWFIIVGHVCCLSLLCCVVAPYEPYPFGNCKKSLIKHATNCYCKLWQISCASRSWQLNSCSQLQFITNYSFNMLLLLLMWLWTMLFLCFSNAHQTMSQCENNASFQQLPCRQSQP